MSIDVQKARKERHCRRCGERIPVGKYCLYAGMGLRKVTICEDCMFECYTAIKKGNSNVNKETSNQTKTVSDGPSIGTQCTFDF